MRLLDRLALTACCGLTSICLQSHPASAAYYCVPGVTAERCRGTFWETGSLYKKGQEGGVLSTQEYAAARDALQALRSQLVVLGTLADQDDTAAVGAGAARVRAELRVLGERISRSAFVGDERIDSEQRLKLVLRALDDIDRDAEQSASDAKAAPGFGRLRIMLDACLRSFDSFVREVPAQPDPDAF
jgi:hypothetical protein